MAVPPPPRDSVGLGDGNGNGSGLGLGIGNGIGNGIGPRRELDPGRRRVSDWSSMLKRLPGTVIALGAVSQLTDLSSEMIYPLLPLFLTTVLGAGALSLGVIEGVAESTAAMVRVVSGVWSDRVHRRTPFVLGGYAVSGLARPFIALAGAWPVVLGLRFVDRLGKGARSAPRDAIIADVVAAERRGEAFGFHRSMDHAGAVLGPLVAAVLLHLAGLDLRQVFLLTAIPAAAVVVVILAGVREPARPRAAADRPGERAGWNRLGGSYRRLLVAVAVFTLGNSSDAFLLLRLSTAGVSATWVAVLWSCHHVVKMVATYVGGRLSDRRGRRSLMIAGWAVYAAIYLGFAVTESIAGLVALFLAYGLYFGLTEPVEKALVTDLAPPDARGAAFGFFHGTVGLAALPASVLFGLLWKLFGVAAAFATGAALAAVATLVLLTVGQRRQVAE